MIALLVLPFVFALITAFIAGQRGYDPISWYMIGLPLGPLGLLAAVLPRRRHEPEALFGHELQGA